MQWPREALLAALLTMILVQAAFGQRKTIRSGWNLFSTEQDIALGQEAAAEIETQVEVVDDQRLTEYIGRIGERLAAASQDFSYPSTFKVVADPSINVFALPGGPTYVNSGLIAAADNEVQLVGVMAHEIGHVVLRHSINQASKRSLFQLPAVLADGALGGSGGMLGSLANIGIGFGLNSVFMKYSRSAERDADIVGARMMAAAGYDLVQMAHFFEKLEEAGAASGPQFLSDHPNLRNRVQYITEEIESYRDDSYTTTSPAFADMRSRAVSIEPITQESPATSEVPNAAVEEQGIAEAAAPTPLRPPDQAMNSSIPMTGRLTSDPMRQRSPWCPRMVRTVHAEVKRRHVEAFLQDTSQQAAH
jgi:predicted Zn-dependent protease